jgi:hypothetical protein
MNGYERMMMAKIEALEKKVLTAKRYCETEEEAHRNNVDFNNDHGFIYYSKQLHLIPERREASLASIQRKKDTFTAQKESAISKLRADAELLRRKMEQKETEIGILEALIENNNSITQKETEDTLSKYDSQVTEYIQKTKDIKESLSYPTGKMYLKNRELIGILEKEIAEARRGMDEILEQDRIRKRASMQAEMKREIAEAERRAEEERLQALRIKAQERIAIEEKKQARRDALRKEREQEVLEELENLEKTQNSVLGK